ncbi:MAG: restriction endonuclease S subunit [bacterium]|jgi:restriction endonuclease S subunit
MKVKLPSLKDQKKFARKMEKLGKEYFKNEQEKLLGKHFILIE